MNRLIETIKAEEKKEELKGYHYTNLEAYNSMKGKGIRGYTTSKYDAFSGIIPSKRFINLSYGNNMPDEAYDGVIEGLLEPEPETWIKNAEFPHLWNYLMHDICRRDEVILLSFKFKPTDEAYIVDRAHIERELYRKSKGQGEITRQSMNKACKQYWDSRINIFEYTAKNKNIQKINYSVPQLVMWSGIEFERLNIEWIKPTDEVWKRVVDNNW